MAEEQMAKYETCKKSRGKNLCVAFTYLYSLDSSQIFAFSGSKVENDRKV